MTNNYDDILHLPHHTSSSRPRMSMEDRAAQFSPFAALTGYDAAIKETGRLTDERIDLGEEALNLLNMKFQILADNLKTKPEVTITYFKPDERKDGGAYLEVTGVVRKIDEYERILHLTDRTKLRMDDVFDIQGEIFSHLT